MSTLGSTPKGVGGVGFCLIDPPFPILQSPAVGTVVFAGFAGCHRFDSGRETNPS